MAFRHVDLCSGIGGFALGFEWAELSSPILFCDIEPWSRKILAKHWPDVPIAEDVKELAGDPDRNVPDCDILTAGYPCQPFSLAGKRGGEEDPRHIWPYILRIVASKRPSWCVFENVYGHLTLGLDQVLLDLEAEGYATRPFIVPACSVDAPHRRDRVWIIAKKVRPDTYNTRQPSSQGSGKDNRNKSGNNFGWSGQDVADTYNSGREEQRWPQPAQPKHQAPQRGSGWLPEPAVGRVANGIPRRVDRLKGLGNAIVPQIAMQIGKTIKAVHDIPAQGYAHNNSNNQTT
jgi:DNA (cytosine-5)-methyltransferase 1